jgi:hypothetical protein
MVVSYSWNYPIQYLLTQKYSYLNETPITDIFSSIKKIRNDVKLQFSNKKEHEEGGLGMSNLKKGCDVFEISNKSLDPLSSQCDLTFKDVLSIEECCDLCSDPSLHGSLCTAFVFVSNMCYLKTCSANQIIIALQYQKQKNSNLNQRFSSMKFGVTRDFIMPLLL